MLSRIVVISDSDAGPKQERSDGVVGGKGECGNEVAREIRSLDSLSLKTSAKLTAREIPVLGDSLQ